jgi:rhodanese-related sulfurtransferase
MTRSISVQDVRAATVTREELALLDLRIEAQFALGHPLFAAQLPPERIALEAPQRLPRKQALTVLYDDGEGLVEGAADRLAALGYENVYALRGDLRAYREAGFELFQDVNSYSKAFGELVESRRHTPSLSAQEVQALLRERADVAIVDARRFDEYNTMNIPGSTSVPGAELVLRAQAVAPDARTTLIVNCAGRTRSIIGAQSLRNAGIENEVFALRNGTIGWTLAGQTLEHGQTRSVPEVNEARVRSALERARGVAYRAGVRRIEGAELRALEADTKRGLYRFDVRTPEEFARGHLPGFRSAPGGQLVQEADMFAPLRGARIVLADDLGSRAYMTASWLAQMAWDVYVLEGPFAGELARGADNTIPARSSAGRYKRPYEGTDNAQQAMQAYLEWEYGLVAQLERDGSHGFFVI